MSLSTCYNAVAGCSIRGALRTSMASKRLMSSSACLAAPGNASSSSGGRQGKPKDRYAVATPQAQGAQQGLPVLTGSAGGSLQRGVEKHFYRGRTYAPQDLNLQELYKEPGRRFVPRLPPPREIAKQGDVLHKLKLRPGHPSLHDDSYKNPILLSMYVSEMGKILPRSLTRLTRRSQREVGKAVRRARSMGLMPVMSKNVRGWSLMRNPSTK